MSGTYKMGIHWYRRDLRIADHKILRAAALACEAVCPLYIVSTWQHQHHWTGPNRQQFLCDSLASLADILPTFCDYAGLPMPKDLRGESLRSAVEGRPLSRKIAVSELRYGDEKREGRMLRSAQYKYVAFNGGARPHQLFDLSVDPGETQNLAYSAVAPPVLREYRELLRGWLTDTRDDFTPA